MLLQSSFESLQEDCDNAEFELGQARTSLERYKSLAPVPTSHAASAEPSSSSVPELLLTLAPKVSEESCDSVNELKSLIPFPFFLLSSTNVGSKWRARLANAGTRRFKEGGCG